LDLEQRVAELERRAIRYRNTLVLLVVGVCAVVVVGATTDDGVIRGQYLFLENEHGETVVFAGVDTEGHGFLTVSSRSGTILVLAAADSNGHGALVLTRRCQRNYHVVDPDRRRPSSIRRGVL